MIAVLVTLKLQLRSNFCPTNQDLNADYLNILKQKVINSSNMKWLKLILRSIVKKDTQT